MNEEIKEILDYIKVELITNSDMPKESLITIRKIDTYKLLNYITNLQKENQKLKDELSKADSITQSCIFNEKKENEISYRQCLNMLEDYKQENQNLNKIIDNAIDYIYKNSFDKEEPTKLWFRVFKRDLHGYAQKLLDILKKEVE